MTGSRRLMIGAPGSDAHLLPTSAPLPPPPPILIRAARWTTIAASPIRTPKKGEETYEQGSRFRPDRERALSLAVAAERGGRRGTTRNFHADARGNRQGRRLDGLVPRPVQRLRPDGGLSRSRRVARDFRRSEQHPRLGRDRQRGAGRARRLSDHRALGLRQRLAPGELARRPRPGGRTPTDPARGGRWRAAEK